MSRIKIDKKYPKSKTITCKFCKQLSHIKWECETIEEIIKMDGKMNTNTMAKENEKGSSIETNKACSQVNSTCIS